MLTKVNNSLLIYNWEAKKKEVTESTESSAFTVTQDACIY
jgi:hypothetical protein